MITYEQHDAVQELFSFALGRIDQYHFCEGGVTCDGGLAAAMRLDAYLIPRTVEVYATAFVQADGQTVDRIKRDIITIIKQESK